MQVKVGLFTKAWRDGRNTPFPPGLLTTGTLLPSVLVSCSYCNKLLQTRGVQQQKVPLSWLWFWGIEIGSSLQALGVGRGICSLSHPASGDWWHFSTCGLITPAPKVTKPPLFSLSNLPLLSLIGFRAHVDNPELSPHLQILHHTCRETFPNLHIYKSGDKDMDVS